MTAPALTVGTAGHVDHGKTALVRVLTGKDTDRLPEEHRRGLSIDLGFAPLDLAGARLSLIDVPGHERFLRTMVAGATGVDMHLMCVAADDGVMPQTREHAAVLRHLGVTAGVAVVTKADLCDPARAADEARELLPGLPVVVTSTRTGHGLDELRGAIAEVASGLTGLADRDGPLRLHVDRSFTLRGIGTVVTGTLWSGSLGAGDAVTVLPAGLRTRVRSVEVHDQRVERASAGRRVAVALTGVDRRRVGRGDVIAALDSTLRPSYRLDVALLLDEGVGAHERVQVHHGTRESPARVVLLEGGPAQLRLESPLICARGDRVVLRRLAPPATLGGGEVVDAAPRRRGRGAVESPPAKPTSRPRARAPRIVPSRVLTAVRAALEQDGLEPRADARLAEDLGLERNQLDAALSALVEEGSAVRTGRVQHFDAVALRIGRERVVSLCRREGSATIASVRDELRTSRKFAQAILEYLDRSRVTRRDGDLHVLRKRGTSSEGIEPSKRGAAPPSRL